MNMQSYMFACDCPELHHTFLEINAGCIIPPLIGIQVQKMQLGCNISCVPVVNIHVILVA